MFRKSVETKVVTERFINKTLETGSGKYYDSYHSNRNTNGFNEQTNYQKDSNGFNSRNIITNYFFIFFHKIGPPIMYSIIISMFLFLPVFMVKVIMDLIYGLFTSQDFNMPELFFYFRFFLIFAGILFVLQIIVMPFQKSEEEEIYSCEAHDVFSCSGKQKRKNMFIAYKVAEEHLEGDPFNTIVEKYCCSRECCEKVYEYDLNNNPLDFEEVIKEFNCSTRLPVDYYS